jgi:hypothetical protein
MLGAVIPDTKFRGDSSALAIGVRGSMEYQLSIVSYFDILGMKHLLATAGKDADSIKEILLLFRTLSDPDQGSKDEWGWRFVNFSDLIVRAVPVLSDANRKHRIGLMYHEVTDICNVQANLIVRGVLVRGAMTIGNVVVDEGLAFGEGLARAYLQESTKARFPRIIVDRRLMEMFRSLYLLRSHPEFADEWNYLRPYLRRDFDGVYFLDYLGHMRVDEKPKKYAKFLQLHKDLIIANRREVSGDKRTKEYKARLTKIRWLIYYHNQHVDLATDPDWGDSNLGREELMIPSRFGH